MTKRKIATSLSSNRANQVSQKNRNIFFRGARNKNKGRNDSLDIQNNQYYHSSSQNYNSLKIEKTKEFRRKKGRDNDYWRSLSLRTERPGAKSRNYQLGGYNQSNKVYVKAEFSNDQKEHLKVGFQYELNFLESD